MTRTSTSTRLRTVWAGVLCFLAVVSLVAPQSIAKRPVAQQDKRLLKHEPARGGAERRIALVIGNGAYEKVGLLRNPPNDATLVAATLMKLGFEVTVGTDKSQRKMKELIREFGRQLREGGSVGLFYFAGHGVQAKGHNYLIPVDAEIQTEADLEDAAVDANYVLNLMDDAQNALNIVILDACRNNPFARGFRSAQEGLAQVKAPTGTLIAYATAPDSVAADGGGANSPYAEELTKQIQVSGVLLETTFRRVAEQVSLRSGGRQEPWFSANVKGDFFFSKSPTRLTLSNPSEPFELSYWESIKNSADPDDYNDYLKRFPNGRFADLARRRIASAIVTYVNRKAYFSGELAEKFVAFSFDYPSSWQRDPAAGVDGSPNFVKVEKTAPDGLTTVENFAVGHFIGPKGKMSDMVAQLCEQFSKTNPEFRKVSEGKSVIGPNGGYEFRFTSHRPLGNGVFYIWGRTLLLYDASQIRGVVLVMLVSSKSKDVHGVFEVGEKGELSGILQSFKFLPP